MQKKILGHSGKESVEVYELVFPSTFLLDLNRKPQESQKDFNGRLYQQFLALSQADQVSINDYLSFFFKNQSTLGEEAFKKKYGFTVTEKFDKPFIILNPVFTPEDWTDVIVGSIESNSDSFNGKQVCEIGCGSGILSIMALKNGAEHVTALDLNRFAVLNTQINATMNGFEDKIRVAQSNLLSGLNTGDTFDIFLGCIPQMKPITKPVVMSEFESSIQTGDYYLGEDGKWDSYDLQLNFNAIKQALTHLMPGGEIYLNLANRLPRELLNELFADAGVKAEATNTSYFKQAETSKELDRFVGMEADMARAYMSKSEENREEDAPHCIFYEACPAAESVDSAPIITAKQAKARIEGGHEAYHGVTTYRLTKIAG